MPLLSVIIIKVNMMYKNYKKRIPCMFWLEKNSVIINIYIENLRDLNTDSIDMCVNSNKTELDIILILLLKFIFTLGMKRNWTDSCY